LRIGALSDREEIVVTTPLPPDLVEVLGAVGRVVRVEEGDAPRLKDAIATASALLVSGYVQVPAAL
jgi:hypothetical protein